MTIDWDAYRAAYPKMTYAEVVAFHDRVWVEFPDQEYHSATHLAAFFDGLGRNFVSVIEIGGWRGEAARDILADHPSVRRWDNLELCREAAEKPVTDDPRYHARHPDHWPWELTDVGRHSVAVLAHVIEHMNAAQLVLLIEWLASLNVRHVYVEAPLRDEPRSWRRSTSAHLLEIGWTGVIALFRTQGYELRERSAYPPDRHVLIFGRTS